MKNITVPGVQDVLVIDLFEWSEVFSVHNLVSLKFALNLNHSDIKKYQAPSPTFDKRKPKQACEAEPTRKVSLRAPTLRTAAGSTGLLLRAERVHSSPVVCSNSKRFTRAKAKQTLILHVALVEGEDVLLWEPRTR